MSHETTFSLVLDSGYIMYEACLKSEHAAIENVSIRQRLYAQGLSDLQVTNVS